MAVEERLFDGVVLEYRTPSNNKFCQQNSVYINLCLTGDFVTQSASSHLKHQDMLQSEWICEYLYSPTKSDSAPIINSKILV